MILENLQISTDLLVKYQIEGSSICHFLCILVPFETAYKEILKKGSNYLALNMNNYKSIHRRICGVKSRYDRNQIILWISIVNDRAKPQ